jgi:hypothetical protein
MFVVRRVRADLPFELDVIDVSSPEHEDWAALYGDVVPVVHVNGVEIGRGGLDERRLRKSVGK